MKDPKPETSEDLAVAGAPLPPPLLLMAFILAGFALESAVALRVPLSREIAVTGSCILFALGLTVGILAARALFRAGSNPNPHRPSRGLVVSGVYAWTRNPIYVSMALLLLGFGVLARNGWHLLELLLFLVIVDRTQIPREERYLEGRFGEEFQAYKRKVRRWI